MHLPQSRHHPDPLETLAPHLLSHLPYSLPILRIIQHTAFNPDARIFSTFNSDDDADPQQPWAVVYVERSRFPETESWLFSTFESWVTLRGGGQNGPAYLNGDEQTVQRGAEARLHMLSVLRDVASHSSSLQAGTLPTANTPLILGTLNDTLLPLLAGSDFPTLKPVTVLTREVVNVAVDGRPAQEGTFLPLPPSHATGATGQDSEASGDGGVVLGYCNPIHKFLIPPPPPPSPGPSTADDPSAPSPLPEDYTFSPLHPYELALAVSRSEIPRTISGFSKLGSVGVRFTSPHHSDISTHDEARQDDGEGELISWLFLSPDGSLQSLHTEPAHRGKGVAKAVCRKLMERLRGESEEMGFQRLPKIPAQVDSHDEDGMMVMKKDLAEEDEIVAAMRKVGAEGWAHSDVIEQNKDGAGVARGIGGKGGWQVRWVGVDLERVRRVCACLSA